MDKISALAQYMPPPRFPEVSNNILIEGEWDQ